MTIYELSDGSHERTRDSAYTARLNAAQTRVLRWVAEGCPDGVFAGYGHRISAAALRSRDLITVSGHGSAWHAKITERGRTYLESPPEVRATPKVPRSPTVPDRPARPRALSPTEQLVADLIAADGPLVVNAWPRQGERDYRALISSAQRFGKVPAGKRIVMSQNRDKLEIRLEHAIEGTILELQPVPAPARLSRPHSVAKRFRDETDHHEVSRVVLPRCTRIIHAIAVESERRGMKIENVTATKEYGDAKWSGGNDGHLAITVRGHRYALRVAEDKVPARGRWEREATWTEWSATGVPRTRRKPGRYDENATGRITISLLGRAREGRPVSWADRQAWTLEDKLPELLRELEVRAAEDDHAQAEAERAAQERQRLWEIEIERAKERFAEAHREKVLRAQVAARQQADEARTFLVALEGAHGDAPEATEWIEWIREHIDRLDPLTVPPQTPEVPEPTREDLKPFMPKGMSPYSPSNW